MSLPLRALLVDDEAPALAELEYLLHRDDRVTVVGTAPSGWAVLDALDHVEIDVLFCDVKMPGLDGIVLARRIAELEHRPQVVFVTAYDEHAVDAFDLLATDYVMKPVRAARLAETVRRVVAAHAAAASRLTPSAAPPVLDETIPVELGGITRFIQRSQVRYAQAQGDYARLHTATDSHLVRIPLALLEERWAPAGFVRIHRSTIVRLDVIDEVRLDHGHCLVRISDVQLQVSRRHTRELRDQLVRSVAGRTSAKDVAP